MTPVGLVVVAHSRPLARAAVALAREMAGADVPIEIAAGIDETTFGTDATAVRDAIVAADQGAGVVVLADLGSAVLSAELALDLLDDPGQRDRVRLCPAPLVEGLVVAAVTAAGGADRDTVAAEATAALDAKTSQLQTPPTETTAAETAAPTDTEARGEFTVLNAQGLHARPAARLVTWARSVTPEIRLRNLTTGTDWVPAESLTRVASLGAREGHRVEVAATGPDAQAAVTELVALAARGFDELVSSTVPSTRQAPETGATTSPRRGRGAIAASPGVAIGPAWTPGATVTPPPDTARPAGDTAAERAALDRARRAVAEEITRARDTAGPGEAGIFDAHLLLLDDLVRQAGDAVTAGQSAAAAVTDTARRAAGDLRGVADPYLAARAADIEAIGDQLVRALTGAPSRVLTPPPGTGPVVLVTEDLSPAEAARLDPGRVAGVVLAGGSPTGHAVLLLRARGVPAVVGAGLRNVPGGTVIAFDGATGDLVVDPDPATRAELEQRATEHARRARSARRRARAAAVTLSGTEVLVGANVGNLADAQAAADAGADLAGLVRTEFLFVNRKAAPDVEEQEAAYRAIAEALGGRRITLRTLDVGGDKPLPYIATPAEANPFLGMRGLRLTLAQPELLADQLLAVVRVAHDTPVSVMFPMVATLDELRTAVTALEEAIAREGRGRPAGLQVGIMVEVPAAALKAAVFAPHVDFFSIGTNDLTQYALAAERGNAALAALADALDPGVLRLVEATCRGAGERALVAVCGEVAADEAAVPLLVALGVRELSVAPPAVPVVKDAVRAVADEEATRLAAAAVRAVDAAAVRALVANRRRT